ncbi:MAG: outer membrane beta-barrel protein [Bacteroidales bacterium]|nr:outer membrane beta-barrel protein [Bacteroidales bacterium]MBQ5864193.1 outer membrane beta-barrel protein [Bacteroidales bacterium]
MNKLIYTLLLVIISTFSLYGQNTEDELKEFELNSFADAEIKVKDSTNLEFHIIGVKWGYALSSIAFSTEQAHKSIKSPKNYGIYYTYYHTLWGSMPYFGFHTGLGYTELGYDKRFRTSPQGVKPEVYSSEKEYYSAIEFPLVAQFRYDFWKMRIMLGVGAYGTYIFDSNLANGIPETINKIGVGIIGSGGLAFAFKPIELHFTFDYKYALNNFMDPTIYSDEYWVYTHSNQMVIGVGLYYRFGGKNKKK